MDIKPTPAGIKNKQKQPSNCLHMQEQIGIKRISCAAIELATGKKGEEPTKNEAHRFEGYARVPLLQMCGSGRELRQSTPSAAGSASLCSPPPSPPAACSQLRRRHRGRQWSALCGAGQQLLRFAPFSADPLPLLAPAASAPARARRRRCERERQETGERGWSAERELPLSHS